MRHKLCHDETRRGDDGAGYHCQHEHPHQTVVLLSAIVIPGYWLHALVDSHIYHHKDECHAIGYAVGSHGKVASIFEKALVDKD